MTRDEAAQLMYENLPQHPDLEDMKMFLDAIGFDQMQAHITNLSEALETNECVNEEHERLQERIEKLEAERVTSLQQQIEYVALSGESEFVHNKFVQQAASERDAARALADQLAKILRQYSNVIVQGDGGWRSEAVDGVLLAYEARGWK